jgi:hypothetical protein
VRMRDRNGRQRQLVRGSNYASQAQLVERLHRQVRAGSGSGSGGLCNGY